MSTQQLSQHRTSAVIDLTPGVALRYYQTDGTTQDTAVISLANATSVMLAVLSEIQGVGATYLTQGYNQFIVHGLDGVPVRLEVKDVVGVNWFPFAMNNGLVDYGIRFLLFMPLVGAVERPDLINQEGFEPDYFA